MTKLPHTRIAEGEATGHYHEAKGAGVELYDIGDGKLLLDAPRGCVVEHPEHHPVVLPPGKYTKTAVREYDHFLEEGRSVID